MINVVSYYENAYPGLTHLPAGESMEEEKSVLRWGGLAGILGGILFILTIVTLIAFVGPEPADPEELVMRFPDVRAAFTVGNSLYLMALILWVPLFLALYLGLRGTSLAPALFGSVLGILGLVVLAAGALLHVAFAPISDLYHAPGATPAEQATLVLLWQATQGIFNELDAVGLLLLPIGLIVLGVAMLGAPGFGKGFGGTIVVLGVVGAAGVILSPIASGALFLGPIIFIIFALLLGWKLYSLSKAA